MMRPQTPDQTVVYAVGDIQGQPWAAMAACAFVSNDANDHSSFDVVKRSITVFMGNFIGFTQRASNMETLSILSSYQPEGGAVKFLKGEVEDTLLKYVNNIDGERDEIDNFKPKPHYLVSYGPLRNQFWDEATESQRQFMSSLPNNHTEGDYVFSGVESDKVEGNYLVTLCEASSGYLPKIAEDRCFLRIMYSLAILKFDGQEASVSIIGQPDMGDDQLEFYDNKVFNPKPPFQFSKSNPLVLSNGQQCPVWSSPLSFSELVHV